MEDRHYDAPEEMADYGTPVQFEHAPKRRKTKKRKKKTPVYKIIIDDILLTGIVLIVFATFHHVIPRLTASQVKVPEPVAITTPEPTKQPVQDTPSVVQNTEQTYTTEPDATPEPEITPEPEKAELTWKEKFAEHFSDEIIVTDNSYSSPDISITVSTLKTEYTDISNTQYYVADIYISSLDYLKTAFAYGSYSYYGAQNAAALSKSVNAIVAINGDYADNQQSGFLVRNGEMYFSDPVLYYDICVLYYDGTMETFGPGEYDVDELIAKAPYQSFKFGPALLENGYAKTKFNCTYEIATEPAPRAGIGYYEPGHYCLVVVEGRGVHNSRGLVISEFAQLFEELGCRTAYNLDGGQTAVMTFGGNNFSTPSGGGRDVGEIIYICAESGED